MGADVRETPMSVLLSVLVLIAMTCAAHGQQSRPTDSVTVRIQATDLRSAVEIMQQYIDRPVLFAGQTNGSTVTFETPRPVPRTEIPRLLRALLDALGIEL